MRESRSWPVWLVCLALMFAWSQAAGEEAPVNLAPKAKVSASSEFSGEYAARNASRGDLPSEFAPDGSDWATKGQHKAWYELRWDKPVEIEQIIYFARTTSPILENFKDYAVHVDGRKEPALRGTLEHRYGPQMIALPRQKVSKVRIEFLSAHPDSPNPGASEIAVFSRAVTAAQLAQMQVPVNEKTPQAAALRRDLVEGALGFSDILVVKRKPLNISHVYVYHVEGFRPGGGLYIFSPAQQKLKCIFDAGEGMITTADLSYDAREIVFAMRRGGLVGSNPVAHIEDISRYKDEASNYQIFRITSTARASSSSRTARTTISTPAGCPTAGSRSSPTASPPTRTATW